jgi:hypothetical protein
MMTIPVASLNQLLHPLQTGLRSKQEETFRLTHIILGQVGQDFGVVVSINARLAHFHGLLSLLASEKENKTKEIRRNNKEHSKQ